MKEENVGQTIAKKRASAEAMTLSAREPVMQVDPRAKGRAWPWETKLEALSLDASRQLQLEREAAKLFAQEKCYSTTSIGDIFKTPSFTFSEKPPSFTPYFFKQLSSPRMLRSNNREFREEEQVDELFGVLGQQNEKLPSSRSTLADEVLKRPSSPQQPPPVILEEVKERKEEKEEEEKRSKKLKRGRPSLFTAEEDEELRRLVGKHGEGNWSKLSQLMPQFTRKQLQGRYVKYLKKSISYVPFSPEEDAMIFLELKKNGHKWEKIAEKFPGRNSVSLKNRYYCILKDRECPPPVLNPTLLKRQSIPQTNMYLDS